MWNEASDGCLAADSLGRFESKKGGRICAASKDVASNGFAGSGKSWAEWKRRRHEQPLSGGAESAQTRHDRTDAKRSVIVTERRCVVTVS